MADKLINHPHWHYLYTIDCKIESMQSCISRIANSKFNSYKDYVESTLEEWDGLRNVTTVSGKMAAAMAADRLHQFDNHLESLSMIRSEILTSDDRMNLLTLDRLRYEFDIHDLNEKELLESLKAIEYTSWLEEVDTLLLAIKTSTKKLEFPFEDYFDNEFSPQDTYAVISQNIITETKSKPGRKKVTPVVPDQPLNSISIGEFVTFNATKNYIEGQYEIVAGGIGVTRQDAKKLKREILERVEIHDGSKLFVTTYKSGYGHYVIFVPEENLQRR